MKSKEIAERLGLDKNIDEGYYARIDSYRKRLNTIKKTLFLRDDEQVQLISEWLHSHSEDNMDTTLRDLKLKTRSKDDYEIDLSNLYVLQRDYYDKNIRQKVYDDAIKSCFSISDLDIIIKESKYKYSVDLEHDEFFNESSFSSKSLLDPIIRYNSELNNELQKTLILLMNSPSLGTDFKEIVKEAIIHYQQVKENENKFPNVQDKNPYLSTYYFIRKHYIHNHYSLNLPTRNYFTGLQIRPISIMPQKHYSLKDLAFILAQLLNQSNPSTQDLNKAYDRLKKYFRNYPSLKKKNYSNIYNEFAHYLYLRKKNTSLNDYGIELIISRIESILRIVISSKTNDIDVIFEYINFITEEFHDIISVDSLTYQETMLHHWCEMVTNIFYRLKCSPAALVYINYPQINI